MFDALYKKLELHTFDMPHITFYFWNSWVFGCHIQQFDFRNLCMNTNHVISYNVWSHLQNMSFGEKIT
jgi:hypothetical protein